MQVPRAVKQRTRPIDPGLGVFHTNQQRYTGAPRESYNFMLGEKKVASLHHFAVKAGLKLSGGWVGWMGTECRHAWTLSVHTLKPHVEKAIPSFLLSLKPTGQLVLYK